MTQMSPLMWFNLMILFSLTFLLTNPMNFFNKMKKSHHQNL